MLVSSGFHNSDHFPPSYLLIVYPAYSVCQIIIFRKQQFAQRSKVFLKLNIMVKFFFFRILEVALLACRSMGHFPHFRRNLPHFLTIEIGSSLATVFYTWLIETSHLAITAEFVWYVPLKAWEA